MDEEKIEGRDAIRRLSSLAHTANYYHSNEGLKEAFEEEIDEFKNGLNSLDDNKYSYEELEELLSNLYKMNYLDLTKKDELLIKYEYEKKYISKLHQLLEKKQNFINGEYSYTSEEYNKMLESLQDDRIDKSINNQFADICIKAILEQKHAFTEDEIVEIFNQKIESITSNISNRKIKLYSIYGNGEDQHGSVFNSIKIGEEIIYDIDPNIYVSNKLFTDNPMLALITSFHEMIHQLQYDSLIINKKITAANFINITDTISRFTIGEDYYKQNYTVIYEELEAYIVSHEMVKGIIKDNNITISEEQKKYIDETIEYYKTFYNNQTYLFRRCDDKVYSCIDLLNQQLANNPKYFDFFPQLSMLYKKENGNVMAKTKEELISDYSKYSLGKLQLNGNQSEISNIYLSHIKALASAEKIAAQNELKVDQVVELMAQGVDVEQTEVNEITTNKQMGYTVIGILSAIAFFVNICFIVLGVYLNLR